MNAITRILAGAAIAFVPFAPTAASGGATHEYFDASWEETEAFAAGEGSCVDWAGTFHEVREGGYELVFAPGGQQDGEFHVNGSIEGHIDLVPNDPSLPSYSGDYREKTNGVAYGEYGDLTRVMTYRLRIPMTGTDGSTFTIIMSGKVTENANGDTVVQRETFECH